MSLTSVEILLILETLGKVYGPGYSKEKAVGRLQAKLSLMLEVAQNEEREESR